jgi:hypothetical protein
MLVGNFVQYIWRATMKKLLLVAVLMMLAMSGVGYSLIQAQDGDCPPAEVRAWLAGWEVWLNATIEVRNSRTLSEESLAATADYLLEIGNLERPACADDAMRATTYWYALWITIGRCELDGEYDCTGMFEATERYDEAMQNAVQALADSVGYEFDASARPEGWSLPGDESEEAATTTITVTAQRDVNVRSGPGTDYPVTGALSVDDTVEVAAYNGDWLMLAAGGWVASWVVTVEGDVESLPFQGAPPPPPPVDQPSPGPGAPSPTTVSGPTPVPDPTLVVSPTPVPGPTLVVSPTPVPGPTIVPSPTLVP